MRAVVWNNRDAAKILLRAGADVRKKSKDGAKMLLRAGADVRKKSKGGDTVFDVARNNEQMLKILNQHQQVSGIF